MHSVDTAPVEIPKDRRRWTQIVDSIKKAIFILGTTCVFYHCSQQLYNLVRKLKHIKVRIFHTPFPPTTFPDPENS